MRLLWVLCLLPAAMALFIPDDFVAYNADWELWKMEHGKSYGSASEEQARRTVWQENMRFINEHNEQANQSFTLAMNQFGDLTNEEFAKLYLGTPIDATKARSPGGSTFLAASNVQLPDEVDWRKEGYVTPVKNQGACGSCWAFSTTGSVEGQHFKKTKTLVSLSEQNLVDCSTKQGDHGCQGGLMDLAFTYIKENGGIDTEASYPYTARDGSCHYDASHSGATVTGYTDVKREDEDALQQAVATVGPISVAIDASSQKFRYYKEGVFYELFCSQTRLDHGVLAVGYGTEDGKDYWLVKNSWGSSWGMQGYIMMSRNRHNNCGIATQASFPLV